MLEISDLEVSDLLSLEKIHTRDFPLPNVNDSSYIIKKVLLKDDEVVGAAFARVTSEIILVLDPKLTDFQKAKLWMISAGELFNGLLKRNIKSTHVFVTPESDENYAKILEDRMGFVRATGIPLYLEVK